jgi:hypothetical protein
MARRKPLRLWIGLALLALAPIPEARGESAADLLQPRLRRVEFAAVVSRMELERDQQILVEMLFSDYASAWEELAAAADDRADQSGRRRLEEALTGRAPAQPDELRRLQVGVLEAYLEFMPQGDALLEQLFESLVSIVRDEQRPLVQRLTRDLRRQLWLAQRRQSESFYEYAGEGVDVARLIEEAARPGGELEGCEVELQPLIEEYAQRMDRWIVEVAPLDRAGVIRLRLARARGDAGAVRAQEQEALVRWRGQHELNRWAAAEAERVASLRTDWSKERAQRWRQRFNQACFPWLAGRTLPERQWHWIETKGPAGEVRQRAQRIYGTFVEQHRALVEEAIEMLLRARLELHRVVHPMSDPAELTAPPAQALHQAMLKNSGERSTLEAKTGHVLEAVLTPEDRERLRQALR